MASHCNGSVVEAKMVSEAVRELETFQYNFISFDKFHVNNSGQQRPSSELASCSDSILTGLAQLGVYQTNTERSYISLFSKSHQYIIAETVPSMRLVPRLPSHESPSPLTHCGTAIPREHGLCEHVLYDTGEDKTKRVQLPALIVPNMAVDARFNKRSYCKFGEKGQFFAAVPIRTRRGINIGSYCVFSSKKPDSWDEPSVQSLRDISHAIMDHLDAKRSENAHRRSERINRGLGSFIEGKSTLSGWHFGPHVSAFTDNHNKEGTLNATQQRLEYQHQKMKDDALDIAAAIEIPEPAPRCPSPRVQSKTSTRVQEPGSSRGASPQDGQMPSQPPVSYKMRRLSSGSGGTDGVFSKASNIIRESFEVAGCLFFDVSLGPHSASRVPQAKDGHDSDTTMNQLSSTSSSSDDQSEELEAEGPGAMCQLLGFSTTDASSINATKHNHSHPKMAKKLLAKLLRRYPNGKIFNYDAVGELRPSDLSEDDGTNQSASEGVSDQDGAAAEGKIPTAAPKRKGEAARSSLTKDGSLIRDALPAARSVVFFPVWDSRRERWFAGGFIYTLEPGRLFTTKGDLSFLTAFSKLAAAEMHKIETVQADQAKSDALGALSHELRSPLHGVILGAELLNDTDLTVFQGNATHTIETCCRTLLDTIDHLLDYSKVNSFASMQKMEARGHFSPSRKRQARLQAGHTKLHTHASLDGIVEEVIESVFAGFNFQHMSVRQLSKQGKRAYTDTAAMNRQDSAHAMEQLGPTLQGKEQLGLHFGDVSVYVSVDSTCDWRFYLQAGAIRRLVMNLVGNALKYTDYGAILVSLRQESSSTRMSKPRRVVKLVVEDTGKGISKEYLQHKLFQPFAQEDDLAPGTGLGLSLVKKIISQLDGHIDVKSSVGAGSIFTVTFPLEKSPRTIDLSEEDEAFETQVRDLAGLRVRLSGFDVWGVGGDGSDDGPVINGHAVVESICRDSLRLEVVGSQAGQVVPDLVLWSDKALMVDSADDARLSETPNIVICQNALVAYQRNSMCDAVRHSGVFEFVSQPIGPRKLAMAIQLAYKRWTGLNKMPPTPRQSLSPSSLGLGATPAEMGQNGHSKAESMSTSRAEMGVHLPTSALHLPGSAKGGGIQPRTNQEPLGGKLLLVDDNHINLKVLSAYVRKLGREYETATNGREAVEAYTRCPGDFVTILMDISMPIMDGLTAARQIRALEQKSRVTSPVPIVALTGMASDAVHRDALESGVDVYLTKPVRLGKLGEVLSAIGILTPPQVVDDQQQRGVKRPM